MGRNSKKNKGRKPAIDPGLKGAASLASSSANVATPPARPARTAKHKVRKFPSQPATTTSAQANDSRTARGLKETQPVLAPHNTVKRETPAVGPSTTPTSESLHTRTAIVTESAETVGSSHEKEIAVHQPITANLSDSYDSSSGSSSETDTCMQDDVDHIPMNTDNVVEMHKLEQLGEQNDEKPKVLVAEEYTTVLLEATESKEVPQRADSSGHTSGVVAMPSVAGPFTATLSPRLHQKLEAEISVYSIETASRVQADEAIISFGEGAEHKNNSPLLESHPDKNNEVSEVLSSFIKMETSKQIAGDDRSSAPAIVGRKEDSNLVNAEPDAREQSSSESEISLIDALITPCTSPNNLEQKHDEVQVQELEVVLESFDHTPAEKNNEPGNFVKETESTSSIPTHQILPSRALYEVVQDTNEENRQVNVCCIEEAPPLSIQESASSSVEKQLLERDAQEALDVLPQQERKMSALSIEMLQKDVIQPLQATDSHPTLESEQGQTPIVQEQHIHTEVEQEHEPKDLKRTNSGTIGIDQGLQPLTVDKESTTSIHSTNPVDMITEAQQDIHESHPENLSISENAAYEAQEIKEENSLVCQTLEHQEDVDVKLEAQSVLPEAAATCEMHSLLSSEQYAQLVEPDMKTSTIDCQEKPNQTYVGSIYDEHTIGSVENEVEKVEMAETEVEDLELKGKKNCQDEQSDDLDRGTIFEGHATNLVGNKMEKLECTEVKDNSNLVDQEECHEEKPEEQKTTHTFDNDMKKHDEGETQAVSVTLDKDWDCQEEKPDQLYNDSVCKEHTRSLENAVQELEVGQSEEAIVVEEEDTFKEKPSQLDDSRKCAQKVPEVEALALASATPDSGYVYKEETNLVENQELEVDDVAVHEQEESPEGKPEQLDRGLACEDDATNSVDSEKDNLQVGEPEVNNIGLNVGDYLQENPYNAHAASVYLEHNSQENVAEKVDMGEPPVGGVTLHEHEKCKEDEPDQQLDGGIEGQVKSIETEMKECEVGQLDQDECLQEKADHAHCGLVCQEDKNTESLEKEMSKFDVGKPLEGGDKDLESPEEKFDKQLDAGTICEEHATNSINTEMPESKNNRLTLNKQECQEEKADQAHSDSVCEEHDTKDPVENVEKHDTQGEDVTLDQEYQEKTPDQVDRNAVCQEHTKSSENEIDKLEVKELEIAIVIEEERECQERHSMSSAEEEMEQQTIQRVESDALEKKTDGTQVSGGYVDKENASLSTENKEEKTEVGEPDIEDVAIHMAKKSPEDQLERLIASEEHAEPSVESEMEKAEVEKPEVTMDKEKCQEEEHHEADVGSVNEENQQTHFLEDALEKPDVGESQVSVMLDKHQELQAETSAQVYTDSAHQEHSTSSMANDIEKPEMTESEKATKIEEKKKCQEEHAPPKFLENEMEQPEPEVESVTLEKNKESREEISGQVFKEQEVRNELEEPEVAEPEVDGVALQREKEIREDELDKLTISEEYAREKLQGAKPEVALDKDECNEEKHYQADDGSLYEEHQQTDLDKDECKKEKHYQADGGPLCEENRQTDLEHAMEGAKLDKELEPPEDKPDKVSIDSGSQEPPTSYSTGNVNEVQELEQANALEERRELPEEYSTTSVENETESPTPQVEKAILEEKKESPNEMHDQIDSGYVGEENEMHSGDNELEKPEVEEAEMEDLALCKKKDGQGEEPSTLEVCNFSKEDAKDSIEIETEKHEVGKPDLNNNVFDKEDIEEERHHQANDGSLDENHQVTDFQENALEKTNVEEPDVGVPNKEEAKDQEADDGSVYEEHPAKDFCEDGLETPNVEEDQVRGIILDQEKIPDQVDSDSVSQEEPTSSMKNEIEKLEVESSEKAITIKEEKDCQEDHTTKSVENEMDQPEPVAEIAALEEKKDSPEELPDQIDRACASEEYKLQSLENELEKSEVGELEDEGNADHGKKEWQEQDFNCLERDAQNVIDIETVMLEAGKPEVNSTTPLEEEENHDQADGGSVSEEHQETDFLEHAMEKPDVGEPHVKDEPLEEDQETPEEKSDQVDREKVCQEDPTISVVETQIAIGIEEEKACQEEPTMENKIQQPEAEEESTALEEKKEGPEQMLGQVDGSDMHEDHGMPSVAIQLENAEMGEPEVESIALHKTQESLEDQLEELDTGTMCEVHTETSIENAIGKPEINNTTLDKEECRVDKNDQADSCSASEKHQVADFPENTMENPDMEEAQAEGATLNNEQELPEEKIDQAANGSACKDDTKGVLENNIKESEVGESEAAIALYEEKECQEAHLCQLNVCDEQSMTSADNTKENPEVREPEVEISLLEKTEEYLEETSNRVESDSVYNEHEPKSMEVSEMEEPEHEDVALYQRNDSKKEADEVSSSTPNEELIKDSIEKDLERLEVDETRVSLALQEKEDCQLNQADHNSFLCEGQAPKSAARELELIELEEPEAGIVKPDKKECEDVAHHQKKENKEGEADKDGTPNTDSGLKVVESFEVREAQVGLALEEMENCQPENANSASEEQAQKSVANELRPVELEEPEADTITLDKMECEEDGPGQAHSRSICEEQTPNLIENESEKPKMDEPRVDCVELDKEILCQEEYPADLENCSQNTSFLEDKTEKLKLEEPDGSDAALKKLDCGKEPYQLDREPITVEQVETLQLSEPKGSVKLECQEEPADDRKVPQGQEQTTSTLEIEMEELQVVDPEVTFEEDDKPIQLEGDSEREEQDLGEQEVESVALQEKNECQEENTTQLEKEPGVGDLTLTEIKGCNEDKSNQIEECPAKEEFQEENSDRISADFVCEDTQKEKLEIGDPKADNVLLTNEELQKEKVCDSSEGDRYTARSVENIEKLEVENSEFEEEKSSKERPDFAEKEAEISEEGEPEVEVVKLDKNESQSEKPDQLMRGCISEEHSTDLEEHDMDKLLVSQPELGGDVALDDRNECQEEKPDATADASEGEIETPGEEVVALEEEKNCYREREHKQAEDNTCVRERMVECVENEREEPEMGTPKVEDLLDEKEHQSEEPDVANSDTTFEEHATSCKEDDMNKFEVDHPEVENPHQVNVNRSVGEEHTSDSAENETENAELREPDVKETVRNTSECGEHATDSKEDDMDKLEVNQPEVGILPHEVISTRSDSTAAIADFVENETEKLEIATPAVERECHSERSNPDECSSVCEESVTDSMDALEVNQPKVEKLDEVIVGTTSMSEAHTLDFLQNETENSEVGVLELEDNVLDEESHSEKPDHDKSSSICEENATGFQEQKLDKLETNQPEVDPNSSSVHERRMLDPHKNEAEKAEGEPWVKDIPLEEKECIPDKPYQDESSSVDEVHATESKEDDTDKLEVNLPAVGKPDQVIAGSISTLEAHTGHSLQDEMINPDEAVPEDDDEPEQKKCLDQATDHNESGSVHEEHATNADKDDIDKPEVNQPEVGEPDEVVIVRSVCETDTLDSLGNGPEKPEEEIPEVEENMLEHKEEEIPEVEDNMLKQKECLGEKPDQATDSKEDKMAKPEGVPEEGMPDLEDDKLEQKECPGEKSYQATDSKEDDMENPDEGVPKVEDNVLEQKECFGEKPDQDDSTSIVQEHATENKADGKDKLQVEQPQVEEPDQIIAHTTSLTETQGVDSLMGETQKPEGVLEVDNEPVPKECLGQVEISSLCEEDVAESKEVDMDKLEINQPEVGVSQQAIASSAPVSEACELDSQETKTENKELPKIQGNVPEENVGEKPHQDESSCVFEEHATNSQEEDTDKLKVDLPQPDQDNVLLEEGKSHNEKPDQEESSPVCEGHATDSKEIEGGNVEMKLPETDQVITNGTSVGGHILNSVKNGTEEPEKAVPEVQDDGLACGTFFTCHKATASSANDCLKTKEQEQEAQPANFQTALNPENREDHKSDQLSMTQDVEQTSVHDFSTNENVLVELSDLPAEGKQEKEFDQGPGNSKNGYEQLHNPSSREGEWNMESKEMPAVSKSDTEEIEFRQTTEISEAPKPQEGTQEILEHLDAAKPEEAKQEPTHHLQSREEDQEVHQKEEPDLSQGIQKHESGKVNAAIPLMSISAAQEEENLDLTTGSQEVEAEEKRTLTDEQTNQCQGISLPTLDIAKLPAPQEAIPVDGVEAPTMQSSSADVKDTFVGIEGLKDSTCEQHSPQSVLNQQESPAEKEKAYGIQEVAATQYQLDHAELSSGRDVDTTPETEEHEGNFDLEETASICIPLHSDVAIYETVNEPAKENLVKRQHEEQNPACNRIIPILSSEEGMKPEDGPQILIDEAFQSVPTPVIT